MLNYRGLHLFYRGLDSNQLLFLDSAVQRGGLRDCPSISFIMMTVLPFECNETGSQEGGRGLVGHLFLFLELCKTHTHAPSEGINKVTELDVTGR